LAAYANRPAGKLSLDEHPGQYIPRLQGDFAHRSSHPPASGHLHAGGICRCSFDDRVGDDEAALGYRSVAGPGSAGLTVRDYSNPSIGLLGAVTAAALNDRFATLIETQLLQKFGMRHSYLHVPARAMRDYAWGHRKGKAVRVNPGPMDEPSYGIKTTAADMIRFLQANIDPSGLEAPLRRAVETTQMGRFRVNGMVQGFGWEQFPYPLSRELLLGGHAEEVIFETNPVQPMPAQAATEPRLFNKTGSTGGFAAYVVFVPAKRIGLVMLANRSYPIPARVEAAYTILRQLAPSPR
jgi:beta-lactamase class C